MKPDDISIVVKICAIVILAILIYVIAMKG